MKLSDEDKKKLAGGEGASVQEAMEYLVKLGQAFEAEEMVDVHSVHIFTDYQTIGEGGLELYAKFADMGAECRVHSSCEPISIDLRLWPKLGLPPEYPGKQIEINNTLRRMGFMLDYTCIFHFNQNIPKFGENLAWIEGNATAWANSIIGARGNRENSITCFLAGIAGRIPKHGLLIPENRKGQRRVEIDEGLVAQLIGPGRTIADLGALGMIIADLGYDTIPVVEGLPLFLTNEQLKAIFQCCGPVLTTALLLLVGISPEAPTVEAAFGGTIPANIEKQRIEMKDIQAAYENLTNAKKFEIDIVSTGCPFKTIYEVQAAAKLLEGKKVKDGVLFFVHTDFTTWHLAEEMGLVEVIEKTGAYVTRDLCPFCLPLEDMYGPDKVVATDSIKTIRLLSGKGKPRYCFGSLEDCVNAAVTGSFRSTRWS
jgi:predicted aconitase